MTTNRTLLGAASPITNFTAWINNNEIDDSELLSDSNLVVNSVHSKCWMWSALNLVVTWWLRGPKVNLKLRLSSKNLQTNRISRRRCVPIQVFTKWKMLMQSEEASAVTYTVKAPASNQTGRNPWRSPLIKCHIDLNLGITEFQIQRR